MLAYFIGVGPVPVTYKIDAARRLIYTTCSGPVELQEIADHFQQLLRDPECVGAFDVLLDVSAQQKIPISTELGAVTREIAAVRRKVQFGSCAIVAPGDVMFGMMRMFEIFATPYFKTIRVFRSLADAQAWLGLEHRNSSSDE
jgi:hypothetical protein